MISLWIKIPHKGKTKKYYVDGKTTLMSSISKSLEKDENIRIEDQLLINDNGIKIRGEMLAMDFNTNEGPKHDSMDAEKDIPTAQSNNIVLYELLEPLSF